MKKYIRSASAVTAARAQTYNKDQLVAAVKELMRVACEKGGYKNYHIKSLGVTKHTRPVWYMAWVDFSFDDAVMDWADHSSVGFEVPTNEDIPLDYYSSNDSIVDEVLGKVSPAAVINREQKLWDSIFEKFKEAAYSYAKKYRCSIEGIYRHPEDLRNDDLARDCSRASLYFDIAKCPSKYSLKYNSRHNSMEITDGTHTLYIGDVTYDRDVKLPQLNSPDDIEFSDMDTFFTDFLEQIATLEERLDRIPEAEDEYNNLVSKIESRFPNVTCIELPEYFGGWRKWYDALPSMWIQMRVNVDSRTVEIENPVQDIFNVDVSKLLRSIQGKVKRLTHNSTDNRLGSKSEKLI